MNQERAPLYEKIKEYVDRNAVRSHVPGHKGGVTLADGGFPNHMYPEWLLSCMNFDVTELPDLDDLQHPEGAIAEAQCLAAELFGAEETFFLVNGSTVGNLALVLTVCHPGDLLLVQRNVHKSVLNGLMLAGARAVFLEPDADAASGTALGVGLDELARALVQYPQAKGVFLTNPTYYGAALDLRRHAELVHGAGMVLLVDEAHGAHFGFHPAWPRAAARGARGASVPDWPPGDAGTVATSAPESLVAEPTAEHPVATPAAASAATTADAAVQSTHKMLAALTQAGMLHVNGARLDRTRLRQVLAMLQSSSPSYILMASLDLARARLAQRGTAAFAELLTHLDWFRSELSLITATDSTPVYQLIDFASPAPGRTSDYMHDPCKLVLQMRDVSGFIFQHLLIDRDCYPELADERNVLLALSIETTRSDLQRLLTALTDIATDHKNIGESTTKSATSGILRTATQTLTVDDNSVSSRVGTNRLHDPIAFSLDMLPGNHKTVDCLLGEALGRQVSQAITPYPPGIPLLLPGETVTVEQLSALQHYVQHGARVHGIRTHEGQAYFSVFQSETDSPNSST